MKKSLLLLTLCLSSLGTYAQDDDVYFVPSSKDKTETNNTYTASGRSSYTPITGSDDPTFQQSDWAAGRGNGRWDVDAYNRRGRNYKGNAVADTLTSQQTYDQGYEDGYEDGSCTARIVRFWSPRAGVYVSSPYYMDYYDLSYTYDPFYYGYGSAWSIGWSGWYGWGSWYGWRPYYSWYGWGGWHSPWYDPWYDPWYGGCGWWPRYDWAWRPALPSNAHRGPVGGWTARGGSRGAGAATGGVNAAGRGSSLGFGGGRNYGGGRGVAGGVSGNSRRNFGNTGVNSNTNFNVNTNTGNRSFDRSNNSYNNGRGFNTNRNDNGGSSNRTYSQPSRSNVGSGSFGGGRGFGGGGRSGGSVGGSMGGGRGFGGRR